MSHPLTPQVLTQSSITMLVQVLADDNSARVTSLDVAPLTHDASGNQRERVRVAWQGEQGTGQRDFILYGLPEVTWSETVNPIIPAPAPVLFVESDLPDALTMLREGFVASGRRRGERPAWYLREDWMAIPTIEQSDDLLSMVLEKSATFHALHWGAEPVLNDVYPWLPRFSAWAEQSARSEAREGMAKALTPLTKMPQTLIHGSWQAEHLRLANGELLVDAWDRVMVGPAAWDIYCLLQSLAVEDWERWIRLYCGYLQERVGEFEDMEAFITAVLQIKSV